MLSGDYDYINLLISFASIEGIEGSLIPCTVTRDSSPITLDLRSRPLSEIHVPTYLPSTLLKIVL